MQIGFMRGYQGSTVVLNVYSLHACVCVCVCVHAHVCECGPHSNYYPLIFPSEKEHLELARESSPAVSVFCVLFCPENLSMNRLETKK